jgi:hypothetical protein
MNPRIRLLRRLAILLLTVLLGAAPGLLAAAEKSAKTATPAPGVTNAPLVFAETPRSVFVVPANPHEGRDPFFPESTRIFASTATVSTATKVNRPTIADLVLNGISGTADHPLAIINYHTFENGEEGEVPTPIGRVRIRCVEIKVKDNSVVVESAGTRAELHLHGR